MNPPPLPTQIPPRKRASPVFLAIVIALAGTVVLIVVIFLGMAWLGRQLLGPGADEWNAVQVGMSPKQVMNLMGSNPTQVPQPDGTVLYYWVVGEGTSQDNVYFKDGLVTRKFSGRPAYLGASPTTGP